MIAIIKRLIMKQDKLLVITSFLFYLKFIFSFSLTKRGSNNQINISRDVILRKCRIKIIGDRNKIFISSKSRLTGLSIEIFGNDNIINISDKVVFYESGRMELDANNCSIIIGEKCTFGSAYIFTGENDTSILIGNDCMFSRDIGMNTSDFHSIIDLETSTRINKPKNIIIGQHVWVGNSAFINKGAEIGDHCVIAQRALVPGKFFENNSLIAGFPAKIIKSNISWSREKL